MFPKDGTGILPFVYRTGKAERQYDRLTGWDDNTFFSMGREWAGNELGNGRETVEKQSRNSRETSQ